MAELTFEQSELEAIPQGVLIRIAGVIDVDTADAFRTTLLATLHNGGRRMLLDFSGVEYVESAGFACLVELSQHLRETGGIGVLSSMQPAVQEVILSLGLDAFFGIADNEEKAMTLLKWSAPTAQPQMPDALDGDDSVGFTIGHGHSSGELLPYVPAETAHDEPLFPDAEPMDAPIDDSDDLVAEDYRMSAVGEASEVVTTDSEHGSWDEASVDNDFSAPGESNEMSAIARAIGAPERSTDESSVQMGAIPASASASASAAGVSASGSGMHSSDVRITGQDSDAMQAALEGGSMLPPPPPPPGAEGVAEPVEAEAEAEAVPEMIDATPATPQPMMIPASAEIGRPGGEAAAPAHDYTPAVVNTAEAIAEPAEAEAIAEAVEAEAEAEAVPASESAQAVPAASASAEAVPAEVAHADQADDSEPAADIPAGTPAPTTDAESEEIRLARLRATAKLLQSIPEDDRLWRKVLVYLSHSPGDETAKLNLVVTRLPRNRGKEAFPVAAANPFVTVRPRIPGAKCVPESIAVNVVEGGDEINFRIERDPDPDRPDAPKAPPRLEIWYGPAVIRTVHTANPFARGNS